MDEKPKNLAEIKRKRREWEEIYEKAVKKHPERLPKFMTTSSKPIN